VPLVDVLQVLVLILMLAGTVWGWLRGYARLDISTAVVHRAGYRAADGHRAVAGSPRVLVTPCTHRDGASLRCKLAPKRQRELTDADLPALIDAGRGGVPPWRPWRAAFEIGSFRPDAVVR
jgi:hypothetical protein